MCNTVQVTQDSGRDINGRFWEVDVFEKNDVLVFKTFVNETKLWLLASYFISVQICHLTFTSNNGASSENHMANFVWVLIFFLHVMTFFLAKSVFHGWSTLNKALFLSLLSEGVTLGGVG